MLAEVSREDLIELIKQHPGYSSLGWLWEERAIGPLYVSWFYDMLELLSIDSEQVLEIMLSGEAIPKEISLIYYDITKEKFLCKK